MDSATEEILLQKIEELVLDEDKIITPVILCEKLDVNLTESKYLLDKYVSDQKISPGKISITYLICGKLKNGGYGIQITDSLSLKDKKKLYCDVTNEVIYSIQKSNTVDFNLIALAEKSDYENLRPTALKGSIVSEKCSERVIKTKILPPLPPQKNFEKKKPSTFFKPVPKPESNGTSEKDVSETSSTKNVKTVKTQSQQKPGGIASFFSQNSKKEDVKKPKATESSDTEEERDSKRAKIETHNTEVVESKGEVKTKEVIDEKQKKEKQVENGKHASNLEKNGELTNASIKNKKPVKRESSKKKGNKDGKKRKRIVVDSDSDDDLFGNDEDDNLVVTESDEEKPVVSQPKVPAIPVPKNKRRKAVDKTYEDEDGYVVTRTEYILVSASEEEDEEIPKKEEEKPKIIPKIENKEEKKSPPPSKGDAKTKKGKVPPSNQPTLMNFFKKK